MKRLAQCLLIVAGLQTGASALPLLQLDASPGYYVGGANESTIAADPEFTLFAMYAGLNPTGTFYISAAVAGTLPNSPVDLGSFTFGGQVIDVSADMTWGSPSLMPPHGVYPTWYKEFAFTFDGASKMNNYNVEDVAGLHTGPVAQLIGGTGLFVPFEVDVSGLAEGTTLIFDLYTYTGSGSKLKIKKAPFSHNAEGSNPPSVPDGAATAALLGLGLLGLEAGRRRFLK